MPTKHRDVIGYTISVDKENWLKLSPSQYFHTKAIAVRYGKQNFFTMMKNCGLIHTPGNPATLYIAAVTTFTNTQALPFSYDFQRPMEPDEAAAVQHRIHEFKYHENLIKEQNAYNNVDFDKINEEESLRIRKRHQQQSQCPLFIKLGRIEEIKFEAGSF